MRKTNWEKIKTEYITTKISHADLAKKYKINISTIALRCKSEKWVEERKKHNSKTVSKAVQKVENSKAFSLAQEMAAANMLSQAVMNCLKDPQQFQRWVGTESYYDDNADQGGKTMEEKVFDKFDTRSMRDLSVVLNNVSNLKRDLNNVLGEKDRIMVELAQQRLEIEKMRLEIDRQKIVESTENKDITVVLTDDIEDWAE